MSFYPTLKLIAINLLYEKENRINKPFTTVILITGFPTAVCLGVSTLHSNTVEDIIKNNISSLLEDTTLTDSENNSNNFFEGLVHSLAGER